MSKYGWLLATILFLTSCKTATFQFLRHYKPNITDYKLFNSEKFSPDTNPHQFPSTANITLPDPYLWVQDEKISANWCATDLFEKKNSTAFLVIKNDSLVYEWYGNGYARDKYSQVFSVTKSWTSALIGIAINEGYIKSVHQPVVDYFPEFDDYDSSKKDITLYHLLNMTSGLKFNDYKTLAQLSKLYYCDGSNEQACKIEAKYKPGEVWEYKSVSTLVLGRILEKATGKKVAEYLREKLWEPLQMENNGLLTEDDSGVAKTYCGLSITAIDLAKFGQLYLHKGNWNGQQLVPEAWVDSLRNRDFSHGVWNYSYQWWLDTYPRKAKYKANDFFAGGYKGQMCYVNPDENLVIVRLGKSEGGVNWPTSLSKLAILLSQPKGVDAEKWLAEVSGDYETEKGKSKMKVRLNDNNVVIEKNNEQYILTRENKYSYTDLKHNIKLILNTKDVLHGFFLEQGDDVQYFHKAM